jgi:hypothetical protein
VAGIQVNPYAQMIREGPLLKRCLDIFPMDKQPLDPDVISPQCVYQCEYIM